MEEHKDRTRRKTSLYLDRELYKRLRIEAVKLDTSPSALVEDLMRRFLERRQKKGDQQ